MKDVVDSDPLLSPLPFGAGSIQDTADNEKSSGIHNVFKSKATNGVIMHHPPYCQKTDAPLTEKLPLTFPGTHKIIAT